MLGIKVQILNVLKDNDLIRKEIRERLNIPRTTIFDNLDILRKYELVDCYLEKRNMGKGRPNTVWCITDKGKSYIKHLKKNNILHMVI